MSFIRNFLTAILFFVSSICLAGPVSINSTDLEALASLKGIGPAKATAIIADRKAMVPFLP
jgi:DNA uptake protein ComE-like DNA-binding protein